MTEQELQRLFAKRIRRRLVSLNIDQRELANRTGLTETSISRYINCQRKPTYDIVVRIAQALNCTPGELINIDEILE